MDIRSPTPQEIRIIAFLVSRSEGLDLPVGWQEKLMVSDMQDGGMGGLFLFPSGIPREGRVFGRQASDYQFLDKDLVDVIATLNLDQFGELFELDVWKTDFSNLIQFPVEYFDREEAKHKRENKDTHNFRP